MALTNPQKFEYMGRSIHFAFTQMLNDNNRQRFQQFVDDMMHVGKRFVEDGTFGTQADRAEAMEAAKDFMFTAMTGLDPNDGSHGTHYYTAHFLAKDELV